MFKNILQKIYDFIKETHLMMYNEKYINIYDTHMRMRARL